LLATDIKIVVPVNKVVKVLITPNDVNHAWTVPAFGVKKRCNSRKSQSDLV